MLTARQKQFDDWQGALTLIQGFLPLLLADKLHNVPKGEVTLASLDPPTLEQLRRHRLTPLLYREVMRQGLEKHLASFIIGEFAARLLSWL